MRGRSLFSPTKPSQTNNFNSWSCSCSRPSWFSSPYFPHLVTTHHPPRRMRNGRRRKQPSAPHNLTLAPSSARIQTFGHDSRLSVRRSFGSSSQSKPCQARFSVSDHSTCHPPKSHGLTLLANPHGTRISGCKKTLQCGFQEFSLLNLPMSKANCRFGYRCCSLCPGSRISMHPLSNANANFTRGDLPAL
jgi:hypothetical protein